MRLANRDILQIGYHADEKGFHARLITIRLAITAKQAALKYGLVRKAYYGGDPHPGRTSTAFSSSYS
ncbi:hypothetical protein BIW11_04797 [Tropilaelaps mercedesae]|uniref:Uncharacterized protein n=1 Tax=Tropilaelaps mercedesae TaxID=418985 RepID=A0A1V9X1L7_9ACAR|nr:hypothetical protein BIW11_04797 [Tropilaelaps mercedesae]